MLRGLLAPDARESRAFLIQAHADTFAPKAFLLKEFFHLHLAQPLSVNIGQFKILEHHLDELVEGNFGFIIIRARTIARLLACRFVFAFADDLARLRLPVAALADPGRVFAVDEAVFLHATDRHLDDVVFILADDGLLGDDVRDVVAHRFADFLAVAQPVAGAAVAALSGRGIIRTKDRVHLIRSSDPFEGQARWR